MLLVRGLKGEVSFAFSKEEERVLEEFKSNINDYSKFGEHAKEFRSILFMSNILHIESTQVQYFTPITMFKPYALISLYIYNEMYDRAKRTAMLMRHSIAFNDDRLWRVLYKKGKLRKFEKLVNKLCKDAENGIKKYGKEEYFRNLYI